MPKTYLQRIKDFLRCLTIGPYNIIRVFVTLIFLLSRFACTVARKLIEHLFPKKQSSPGNESERNSQSHGKSESRGFWQKVAQVNIANVQKLMREKIKSWQERIPKCFAKWFPRYVKFDNSKLKAMTTDDMKSSSNQVLIEVKQVKEKDRKFDLNEDFQKFRVKESRVYYVPTYLRVKVKNFTAIDLGKLEAEVNVDVIISFVYGNEDLIKIPKEVAVRLLNEVVLNFERDEPLKLDETDNVHISTKQEKEKYHIQFTVRKKLQMRIESRVYYTPFEQLYLILPITIQQLTPKTVVTLQKNPKTGQMEESIFEASIKFNYMDNQGHFIKLDFTDQKHFGYYSLIETDLVARYSNKRITSIEELQKLGEKKKEKTQANKDEPKSDTKDDKKQKFQQKSQFVPEMKLENQKKLKIQEPNQEKQALLNESMTKIKASKKKLKKSQALMQKSYTKASSKIQESKPQPKKQIKLPPKDSKEKKEEKQELKYFQYSFFKIPIYKHPMASLVMIFLPLWSLGIINLGIFFQENSLSERIASIASLMIAFIALNETIRSQIPPHPQVVFVQLLVYAQMIACFLCLVNSYDVSQIEGYKMVWYECKMFMSALAIFIAEVIIILSMGLYHYYVMVPSYELADAKPKFTKIDTRKWKNVDCDEHFSVLIKETEKLIPTHKGMQEGRKLKDVNEDMKKSSKPHHHHNKYRTYQSFIDEPLNAISSIQTKEYKAKSVDITNQMDEHFLGRLQDKEPEIMQGDFKKKKNQFKRTDSIMHN